MGPLFSIIIANYNYGCFLEDAIRSVVTQSCHDFELIICDGGSSDNSIEIIKRYEDRIAWWCSEKDRGQSDAFNKGFRHASGKFLTWLNADDVLMPGALDAIAKEIERHSGCEWFVGSMVRLDENLTIRRCFCSHRFSWLRAHLGALTGCGPSTFFTKRLLNAVGGVDETLHYVMDIDLWYKFALGEKSSYRRTVALVWGLREHKNSKTSGFWLAKDDPVAKENRRRFVDEYTHSLKQYLPRIKLLRKIALYLSVSIIDHLRSCALNRKYVGKRLIIGGTL